MQKVYKKIVVLVLISLFSQGAYAQETLGSDPRIRTIIYGENDVFAVNAIFGYQTVIEFQPDERVETISIGNPNIFKIIPSKNKLFVKAFQNGLLTNMTLITNKRMYQFELSSNADNPDSIMYLVKFIYPDDENFSTISQGGPMNIYSPMSIKGSSSINLPSMPSAPVGSSNIDLQDTVNDVPLSIKFRPKNERKGLQQSPIELQAPKIGPMGALSQTSILG